MKSETLMMAITWTGEWILTILFCTFKIIGLFNVSWLIVFAPLYIVPAIVFVYRILLTVISVMKGLNN